MAISGHSVRIPSPASHPTTYRGVPVAREEVDRAGGGGVVRARAHGEGLVRLLGCVHVCVCVWVGWEVQKTEWSCWGQGAVWGDGGRPL